MQQLKLLRHKHFSQKGNARYISAWPVEAGHKAELDRVTAGVEYNRDGRGSCLGRERCCDAGRNDHGHLAPHQISSHHGQAFVVTRRPRKFNYYIAALN